MADYNDIVKNALEGDALGVQDAVNQLMQQRVTDTIDSYRQALAQEYYGIPEEADDEQADATDDEQELEQDIEDYADSEEEADDIVDLDTDLEDLLQGLEDTADDEQDQE